MYIWIFIYIYQLHTNQKGKTQHITKISPPSRRPPSRPEATRRKVRLQRPPGPGWALRREVLRQGLEELGLGGGPVIIAVEGIRAAPRDWGLGGWGVMWFGGVGDLDGSGKFGSVSAFLDGNGSICEQKPMLGNKSATSWPIRRWYLKRKTTWIRFMKYLDDLGCASHERAGSWPIHKWRDVTLTWLESFGLSNRQL